LIHSCYIIILVHTCNGKFFERQLQACDVINKQNWMLFYNLIWDIWIFQDYVVHLRRLRRNVFAMIRQLGPPIFFVTFISVESKWFPILKCFYDLNSKKLGFNISFDKLEPKHVTNLVQCDSIACALYKLMI